MGRFFFLCCLLFSFIILDFHSAVLGRQGIEPLARSPALTYLFFYASCKAVIRSSSKQLLKVCGAFSTSALIQPVRHPAFQREGMDGPFTIMVR